MFLAVASTLEKRERPCTAICYSNNQNCIVEGGKKPCKKRMTIRDIWWTVDL